jgi:hypothetical protein
MSKFDIRMTAVSIFNTSPVAKHVKPENAHHTEQCIIGRASSSCCLAR